MAWLSYHPAILPGQDDEEVVRQSSVFEGFYGEMRVWAQGKTVVTTLITGAMRLKPN